MSNGQQFAAKITLKDQQTLGPVYLCCKNNLKKSIDPIVLVGTVNLLVRTKINRLISRSDVMRIFDQTQVFGMFLILITKKSPINDYT